MIEKKLLFTDITRFLEQSGTPFTTSGTTDAEQLFRLASLRQLVPWGIYYVEAHEIPDLSEALPCIVLCKPGTKGNEGCVLIHVDHPQLAHYKLAASLEERPAPGIHGTAIIHPAAYIDPEATIGPYCVLGKCHIGRGVVLTGSVTVNDNCRIGDYTVVEPHTVIGARGMAWTWDEDGERVMQPQTGGVEIGEYCLIGSGISIVRGSLTESTVIGTGTVMAHGSRIGHGCRIGNLVHLANNVSLAGNAGIGDRVFLGSGCVVSSNVTIGEGCIVGAGAVVHKSITETYCTIAGVPAKVIKRNNFESKPKGAPRPFRKK